ncbi:peptide chain release factor-like protein [Ralstonia pseudosolanacearum]|uniref:peptide chain release factor-like protein n=1 Tax=Ralstonia pseudosolanacearum TaxID=1310165 RepID=UPI003CF45AAA
MHSSTVTVSILGENVAISALTPYQRRQQSDFKMEWFNGTTKAGGQHHQKNATCCRMTHLPTGIVRTSQTRSRVNSQQMALAALNEELDRLMASAEGMVVNGIRRAQVGTGERAGVKRRTWRFQEDAVIDHVNGCRARAADVMAGRFDLLWQ